VDNSTPAHGPPRACSREPGAHGRHARRTPVTASVWRQLRILLLLLVLALVAAQAWLDRVKTTSWRQPLWIGIYPLNGDGSSTAARYIDTLAPASFADIEQFFAHEAHRYGLTIEQPVHIELYPSPVSPPPMLAPGSNALLTVWWSLRLRWYAAHARSAPGQPPPQIRVFVLYDDPAAHPSAPHSLGLEKGLIGVVYAFADRHAHGGNCIVITHEVMHTLGATDKYDPASDAPLYPAGYGDPAQRPLYPQQFAEIMAGRRAVSAQDFEMPDSLHEVVVGVLTAAEIRWVH
jgi:hypothetical protein